MIPMATYMRPNENQVHSSQTKSTNPNGNLFIYQLHSYIPKNKTHNHSTKKIAHLRKFPTIAAVYMVYRLVMILKLSGRVKRMGEVYDK